MASFCSNFASGALPSRQDKFNSLGAQIRSIMNDIKKDPQVTSRSNKYEIVNLLTSLQEGLEQCQSAFSAFLESKRSSFTRLWFIGDSDLLEIIGK
jgi:dynein heavy chain 2